MTNTARPRTDIQRQMLTDTHIIPPYFTVKLKNSCDIYKEAKSLNVMLKCLETNGCDCVC